MVKKQSPPAWVGRFRECADDLYNTRNVLLGMRFGLAASGLSIESFDFILVSMTRSVENAEKQLTYALDNLTEE